MGLGGVGVIEFGGMVGMIGQGMVMGAGGMIGMIGQGMVLGAGIWA